MKKYLITFYNDYNLICSCIKKAKCEYDAGLNAEYALICKYPNVTYDRYEIYETVG